MTEQIQLIHLPQHLDERRGNISIMEELPFPVKRIFYIYGVPVNVMRGGHAHKTCKQLLIAVCGAVIIKIGDGREFVLDCPDMALYVPARYTIHLVFLTENTTLLVLASKKYDRNDYIYNSGVL